VQYRRDCEAALPILSPPAANDTGPVCINGDKPKHVPLRAAPLRDRRLTVAGYNGRPKLIHSAWLVLADTFDPSRRGFDRYMTFGECYTRLCMSHIWHLVTRQLGLRDPVCIKSPTKVSMLVHARHRHAAAVYIRGSHGHWSLLYTTATMSARTGVYKYSFFQEQYVIWQMNVDADDYLNSLDTLFRSKLIPQPP